ncbi:MAG: hypothetical protein K0R44_3744 [Thermomicrobiales bacterium]|nr:hypothetical protein [Thermomicrobiales bacterium]
MVEPVPFRSAYRDQMREERLEILRLLEAGTITADEAATLLDALAEYLPKMDAIRESVTAGFRGPLVDVDDGGQRVEIIAE